MRDSLGNMVSGDVGSLKIGDLLTLATVAGIVLGTALIVFIACFCWFRREQNRLKKEILHSIVTAGREPEGVFLTGKEAAVHGELIAQFKVSYGKQVVSILESEGKRFIHVDGELSAKERAKMIHYLKSEGFVS
jgi:hypothetical protein